MMIPGSGCPKEIYSFLKERPDVFYSRDFIGKTLGFKESTIRYGLTLIRRDEHIVEKINQDGEKLVAFVSELLLEVQ